MDPNSHLQPASHISQAPPCNVKRVWTTICYGMACIPLRHNRLAVNPLPVMVWIVPIRRCVDYVAGLHGGLNRRPGRSSCGIVLFLLSPVSCAATCPHSCRIPSWCTMSFQAGFGAHSACHYLAVPRACPSGRIDGVEPAEARRRLIFGPPYLGGVIRAYAAGTKFVHALPKQHTALTGSRHEAASDAVATWKEAYGGYRSAIRSGRPLLVPRKVTT